MSGAAHPAALIERLVPDAPFAESAIAEGDAELRGRLERDGYLFIRGLVPWERLEPVRRGILGLCRDHGWLAPGSAEMDGIYSGRPFPDYWSEYMPLYRDLVRLEAFDAGARAPEIMALMARLLGAEVLAHARNIARIAFPRHHAHTTQPHQDLFYIRGTPATYTAWIPLGDCPRPLGALAVLEGSHRGGLRPHESTIGAGQHGVRTAALGLRWLCSDFRAGDLLLFHSCTVHAALPNDSTDRLRLSVDYRYQRAADEVDPGSLQPHRG